MYFVYLLDSKMKEERIHLKVKPSKFDDNISIIYMYNINHTQNNKETSLIMENEERQDQ